MEAKYSLSSHGTGVFMELSFTTIQSAEVLSVQEFYPTIHYGCCRLRIVAVSILLAKGCWKVLHFMTYSSVMQKSLPSYSVNALSDFQHTLFFSKTVPSWIVDELNSLPNLSLKFISSSKPEDIAKYGADVCCFHDYQLQIYSDAMRP